MSYFPYCFANGEKIRPAALGKIKHVCGLVIRGGRYLFLNGKRSDVLAIIGKDCLGPVRLKSIKALCRYGILRSSEKKPLRGNVIDLALLPDGDYRFMFLYGNGKRQFMARNFYRVKKDTPQILWKISRKEVMHVVWNDDMEAYRKEGQSTKEPLPGNPWFYGAPMVEAGKRIRRRLHFNVTPTKQVPMVVSKNHSE